MSGVDRTLFEKAVQGDVEAFWKLILPYRGLVYSVAFGMLRDHEQACDQLHDVLVTAFHAIPNLRNADRLTSWLYSLTRNRIMEVMRKESRLRSILHEAQPSLTAVVPMAELFEKETWLTHMEGALGQLPEPFRIILALKYMNGYSCNEIAGALELSVSAVKSRLFEARKLLRNLTEAMAGEEKGMRS